MVSSITDSRRYEGGLIMAMDMVAVIGIGMIELMKAQGCCQDVRPGSRLCL
jgi:hypothetical protein